MSSKAQVQKYRERWPEKHRAYKASQQIKIETGMSRHHWCYRIECHKDVIIIDGVFHHMFHKFIEYDPETKMYKRTDNGELLDTKRKHVRYMNSVMFQLTLID